MKVAVVLRRPDGVEFWALVGPDREPDEPCAVSKGEFELRLAAAGMSLTGRELAWTETGLPRGLRRDYGARAFEVEKA